MHNDHWEGCAITVQLMYGPPSCQWGGCKPWPPAEKEASEYKSWKAWAAPFCWTCCIESTPEAGTGPQDGFISFLGAGLDVCAELLNSCGAWRGRSFRRVSPSFTFPSTRGRKWSLLQLKSFPRLDLGSSTYWSCTVMIRTIAPVSPEEAAVFALEHLS